MSLFSIVQGRTPPPPNIPMPAPSPQAAQPMPVAPPAPIGAPYAPMGANIPSMSPPMGGGQMMPPGQPVQAPAQFPPPAMMMGRNIPGRVDGGTVTVPGYGVGDYVPTDDGGSNQQDPNTGAGGSDQFYQQNSGLSVDDWNALSDASKNMWKMALDKHFNINQPEKPTAGAARSADNAAMVGFDYAKLAQDALTTEEGRRDAYAKMTVDRGSQQAILDQKNAYDQAQANQANRLDAGTLGLKAFDSNVAAMRQSGGDYNPANGAWTNAPQYTVNAGEAAGANIPRPNLGQFNIPGVPTAEEMKAYATQ